MSKQKATETGTETEVETETETGRGRTTNAGMATVGRGAAGQVGADALAAAVTREKGGVNGQSTDELSERLPSSICLSLHVLCYN